MSQNPPGSPTKSSNSSRQPVPAGDYVTFNRDTAALSKITSEFTRFNKRRSSRISGTSGNYEVEAGALLQSRGGACCRTQFAVSIFLM